MYRKPTRTNTTVFVYLLEDQDLARSSLVRDPGVQFASNLSPDQHIQSVCAKGYRNLVSCASEPEVCLVLLFSKFFTVPMSVPILNTTQLYGLHTKHIFNMNCRVSRTILKVGWYEIVWGYKTYFSQDAYGLSCHVLKTVIENVEASLANLINNCLRGGVFSDELKVTRPVPIYKKGDPQLLSNYWPISIIPTFGKVFESVIKEQMVAYFDRNNLLLEN